MCVCQNIFWDFIKCSRFNKAFGNYVIFSKWLIFNIWKQFVQLHKIALFLQISEHCVTYRLTQQLPLSLSNQKMHVIVYGKKEDIPPLQSQVVASLHLEFLMGFISLGRESFGICSHAMGVTPQLIWNRFYTISTNSPLT